MQYATFATSHRGFVPNRVGRHVPHIFESHIDYEARPHDQSIERSRAGAVAAIRSATHSPETSMCGKTASSSGIVGLISPGLP